MRISISKTCKRTRIGDKALLVLLEREKEKCMNKKTIFFVDIDGTLSGSDFRLREDVIEAAKEYQKNGGHLVLCTGRSVYGTRKIARQLGVTVPAILYNGAVIYDFELEEILWNNSIDRKIMDCVYQAYERFPDVCIQIFTSSMIYRIRTNWTIENKGVPEERGDYFDMIPQINEDILKVSLVADHTEHLEQCRELFTSQGHSFEFSGRHFVEIVQAGSGKHIAAKKMMDMLPEKYDMVLAAGNGHNDIELLRQSHMAFVPENASEDVKRYANRLIKEPAAGGMKEAFEIANKEVA